MFTQRKKTPLIFNKNNMRTEVKTYIATGKLTNFTEYKKFEEAFKLLQQNELDEINNDILDAKPEFYQNTFAADNSLNNSCIHGFGSFLIRLMDF